MSQTLTETLLQVVGVVRYTSAKSSNLSNASSTGNIGADAVIQFNNELVSNLALLSNIQTVGGAALVAFVQAQYNKPTLDVTTAFNNVKTAMQATVTWIGTTLNGVPLYVVNATTGSLDPAQFTPTQTTNFRTQLAALVTACTAMLPA